MSRRILAVGLDGFELSLAHRYVRECAMPAFARIRDSSARFLLNHGAAKYSGLTWEHVATGQPPELNGRHSAVTFNPATYGVNQEPTWFTPFFARLSSRVVVFDPPYCDLTKAPSVRGITHWGAHDPGAPPFDRPTGLADEIKKRFGPYPAEDHIYSINWHQPEETGRAVHALTRAVQVRTQVALWLLRERLPDWDLGLVVVSEGHSAIEPLWHGVDASHRLHELPSARIAAEGLKSVYVAIDTLIDRLSGAFPDAVFMLFAMHGMGDNNADVASMVLLPELLYRHRFGGAYMRNLPWAGVTPEGAPLLAEHESWHHTMEDRIPPLQAVLASGEVVSRIEIEHVEIDWNPAARYRPFWPDMDAFALPSFYDGRVRLNLVGRERHGRVPLQGYQTTIREVAGLLSECRDLFTGEPVLEAVVEAGKPPLEIGPTEADLYIHWRGSPLALVHSRLGTIGPVPTRRTGGHTGERGFLLTRGPSIGQRDLGEASSFDVVPTMIDLLGENPATVGVTGTSLLSAILS
jgi:predicted AlkP superfamily phosphohydrolase/phosphomutase